ncbi:MAG: alkaline phosphatase family protein [Myxococcales bacterium]|nr:alkaline phosphatase family protein [Myxococcales bacterium]
MGAGWRAALGAGLLSAGVLSLSLSVGCDAPSSTPPSTPAAAVDGPATATPAVALKAPRLVVLLVVDQMRADYLVRFGHLFEDGLDRVVDEGAWFRRAEIAHGVTMTSPGHATIATGTNPSGHGVIQNDWVDRPSAAPAYAVDDPQGAIVGPPGSDTAGIKGRSPAALRRPTIGAWLKQASPASKVVAIAYKDRAAVLMAGDAADGVFWYEPGVRRYVTSSAFAEALPPWVVQFDGEGALDDAGAQPWERALPATAYDFVGPDKVAAEGEGDASRFPHPLRDAKDDPKRAFYRLGASPASDDLSFELALRALDGEGLGADEHPDLLLLSLSGADLVGHSFGPDSHEIVDYYVRLDRRLGDLLRELDRRFAGDYALVITADHGGARLPEVASAGAGGDAHARRITGDVFDREVGKAIAAASVRLGLAEPIPVRDVGEGLWLDLRDAEARGVAAASARAAVAEELRRLDFVADAFSYEELADPERVEPRRRPWLRRLGRSFVADRSPDIQLLGPPGWLLNTRATGTNHGTPYDYDSQVPIVLFGAGVSGAAGKKIDAPVWTIDVAPTIAALLGIATPEVDGRSLLPYLD